MRNLLIIVSTSFVLVGCTACLGKLYRVREEMTPVNVEVTAEFSDSLLDIALDRYNRRKLSVLG
jgi:hypothetical protein